MVKEVAAAGAFRTTAGRAVAEANDPVLAQSAAVVATVGPDKWTTLNGDLRSLAEAIRFGAGHQGGDRC